MNESYKNILKLFTFILIMYVAWQLLYVNILIPGGPFDFWLTKLVTQNSIQILNFLKGGFEIYVYSYGKCTILQDGHKILSVNHACNGQVLYTVFAAFVIGTKGKILNKIVYIVLGSFLIYLVNILRILSLVYIRINYPHYLSFNHKYTFTILVYSVIFAMWFYWINFFSKKVINLKNA